jgi:hypothetical protein
MPRQSAAARAAAMWCAEIGHPEPPRALEAKTRKLWQTIVETRPPDFFRTGSLNLLQTFCQTSVALAHRSRAAASDPRGQEA